MEGRFHLSINDFDDFVAFVALIKGLDLSKIKEDIKNLNLSSGDLGKAVEEADKPT